MQSAGLLLGSLENWPKWEKLAQHRTPFYSEAQWCTQITPVCVCVPVCAALYVCVPVCTCALTCVPVPVSMCRWVHVHVCACGCSSLCACSCVHLCVWCVCVHSRGAQRPAQALFEWLY